MGHRDVLMPSIDVTKAEVTATFWLVSVIRRRRPQKKKGSKNLRGIMLCLAFCSLLTFFFYLEREKNECGSCSFYIDTVQLGIRSRKTASPTTFINCDPKVQQSPHTSCRCRRCVWLPGFVLVAVCVITNAFDY